MHPTMGHLLAAGPHQYGNCMVSMVVLFRMGHCDSGKGMACNSPRPPAFELVAEVNKANVYKKYQIRSDATWGICGFRNTAMPPKCICCCCRMYMYSAQHGCMAAHILVILTVVPTGLNRASEHEASSSAWSMAHGGRCINPGQAPLL